MSTIVSLINTLCAELRSEKVTTRNKAAEQLDNHLVSSKNELFVQLQKRSDDNVSWTTILNSTIDATIKHAIKVDETKDGKSQQTMRNKNYIYCNIINKLLDYNLEVPDHLFTKTTLFNAFQEGFLSRVAVQHFFNLFLSVLSQGLFKSDVYVRELKLNEYSLILSYLFETNMDTDTLYRFESLKVINKTIELSYDYVQLSSDIIDYLPEIKSFARIAVRDNQKSEVIKLYYLMVSQHSVDYHNIVCNGFQELLPLIAGYYQNNMRNETKELLFKSIQISLQILYPYIQQGDFSTINIVIGDTWKISLKKLRTMVEMEIKERRGSHYQLSRSQQNDKSLETFVQMSALVVYLFYWHIDETTGKTNVELSMESRPKILKTSDKLENILKCIQTSKGQYNDIWLSILTELVNKIDFIINVTNYQDILKLCLSILENYINAKNFQSIRVIITKLLQMEITFTATKSIPSNYCRDEWLKIVQIILADTASCSEVIKEKQLLLQKLIKHQKLTCDNCTALINSYITNSAHKRSECVLTVQQILKMADIIGLDKTTDIVTQCITWLYGENDRNVAKTIMLNIDPIEPQLIADTSAIAVINFLDDTMINPPSVQCDDNKTSFLKSLQFKYIRKYLCLENHAYQLKLLQKAENDLNNVVSKNCLFQSNYELLMRTLNFETSKGTSCKDIIADLKSLLKIALLTKSLLYYGAFDENSLMQCPLIKRIGFFLSHLELQFKNNSPINIELLTLSEILNLVDKVSLCFTSTPVLLEYLEKQPIEEMVNFIGTTLRTCVKNRYSNTEIDEWCIVSDKCLCILASLCASSSHWKEAFEHIYKHNFNLKIQTDIILELTKIFCSQKLISQTIGEWFVNNLKNIFKLYHTNVEIMSRLVDLLPAIFVYIQHNEDPLDDMLLAMSSLLKIAFRKSYSSQLTAKIINCICYIVRDCCDLYVQDNFRNLCISIVNFLPFPSLDIKYAAINTITALMDIKWLKNTKCDIELYYEFCDTIYESIKWKKLQLAPAQAETPDQLKNSMTLNVQLLVALLTFSCYHRESALQELAHVCAIYKFTEADFIEFPNIAKFYKTSTRNLIKPCIPSAIHVWISKSYPILKFPFYLCYSKKQDFIMDNLDLIVACLLLYDKSQEMQKLTTFAEQDELLKIALPIINTFILSSQCPANENDEFKNNVKNILKLNLDFAKAKSDTYTWKIMLTFYELLRDDAQSGQLAGFSLFFEKTKWYNINYNQLQSALNLYINNSTTQPTSDFLLNFVCKYPLRLVKTFGALKKICSECIHPIDSIKQFYKFFTLSDMVLETLKHPSVTQDLCLYFTRDIVFYCLHCMDLSNLNDLRKLSLYALDKILHKVNNLKNVYSFMEKHIYAICKSLVLLFKESADDQDIKEKISVLCEHLLENHLLAINDKAYMMSIFANNELSANVTRLLKTLSEKSSDEGIASNWKNSIEMFLENTNCTLDTLKHLKQQISLYKHDIHTESQLLYRLIRQLLQIVRKASQDNYLNLEALKCLGEIGPLNLAQSSYYFEAEDNNSRQTANDNYNHIEYYFKSIFTTLENLLETFEPSTYEYIIDVARYLVNCKYGSDLIDAFPHFIVFRCNAFKNYLDSYDSIPLMDWCDTLKSCESLEYEKFICQFVSKIYENCSWKEFQELAAKSLYFAENSIVPLIQLLLQCKVQKHMNSILTMLEYFFEKFEEDQRNENSTEMKRIYKEKKVINILLNICECIRIHNSWSLPLQLLSVALACNYCQAYFLSIIYLEMWTLTELTLGDKTNVEIMANNQFQQIARKAYESIGCNDAMSGLINPMISRMQYLNLTNNWSDILIESSDSEQASYLCNGVLKRNGMFNLATGSSSKKAASTIDYEICWRLCRWDTMVEGHSKVNTLNDMEYEYEKHHFNALKCLHYKEENNSLAAIDKSRHCVLNILKEISVECLQSVYKYITWLQLLQQCEDFSIIQFSKSATVDDIFKKWLLESNDLHYGQFSSKEQILAHQISLFQTAGIRANRKITEFYQNDPIEKCLLKCIRDCKAAGEINLAKRYISILNNRNIVENPQLKISALLEDVDICMKTHKPEITKSILNCIFKNKEFQCCLQRVKAMQINGELLMETNAETFETVMAKYFMGSLELLEKYNKSKDSILHKFPNIFTMQELEECNEESRKSAFEIIAKYADREYTQLHTYTNSDQFNTKRHIMECNRETANQVGHNNKDRDKIVSASVMKKTSRLDETEIKLVEEKLTINLCIAVENYMKFSSLDSAIISPVIYRIICLWFANKQNEALCVKVAENVNCVPSYKFICALNQMTARLNSKNAEFMKILKEIMVRCIIDHPQQTLYQLYPIVYGYVDGTQNKTDYRSKIAKEIIAKAKVNINANIVKQLEIVIPELVDFANKELNKSSTVLSDKLNRMKNLDAIHCPTIDLPVRIDKIYNITSIVKWNSQISLVGGINAPKKLECLCSDGITRPQLLKGKDDLRQDAVMQQVFSMINNLLEQDPEAVRRKLHIRTYKIVPLSSRSGILEWCLNTIPIGMYLVEAHKKYRPSDYTVNKCRVVAAGQLKSNKDKRLEVYMHICENIKPVFHYFFFEKFHRPGVWFERRLAYINSVATTSMVGFILGLGDRHTQNILIDQETAEVIHIDFGIAFEQGKIMPTPETVPFRLTRDILAPMGITGPNGVFRKSCETTMDILRRHQDVITTILEVLLYDPLYMWKLIQQVNDDNEEKNYLAQRALIAVQNKLEGKQSGIFGNSSVPVQVERLCNEAMNIRNLCMLFPGWDPYL